MSWRDIPGYSGFLWLYDNFVKTAPPNAIAVEVGVALGHSVAYLARRCIEAGRDDIRIYAVDPWMGQGRNGEQQEALGEAKGGDFALFCSTMLQHAPEELERIRVIRETSSVAFRMLGVYESPTIDLVMIDAAHDEASVTDDIAYWRDLVKGGCILAGDDHEPHYPGVEAACVKAFGLGGYEVTGSTWWRRM